jgi:formylglycine-generating enzyme required for sulfatase activity
VQLTVAVVSTCAACQLVGGFESFDEKSRPIAATTHPCDVLPSRKVMRTGSVATGTMVLVKLDERLRAPGNDACYWIEQDETSVGEYAQFVAAARTTPVPWTTSSWCAWKDGGAPSDPAGDPDDACRKTTMDEDVPQFAMNKPIRCVDWCDARAYCLWAGKDLCLNVANAAGTPGEAPQLGRHFLQFEWACGQVPLDPFPSGTSNDGTCRLGGGACALVGTQRRCGPTERGENPGCTTAAGAHDMFGNVREWLYGCRLENVEAPSSSCRTGGYSFLSSSEGRSCVVLDELAKDQRVRDLGFRCCSELTAEERLSTTTPSSPRHFSSNL